MLCGECLQKKTGRPQPRFGEFHGMVQGTGRGDAGMAVCNGWRRPAHWFIWSRSQDGKIALVVLSLSPMQVEEETVWPAG